MRVLPDKTESDTGTESESKFQPVHANNFENCLSILA